MQSRSIPPINPHIKIFNPPIKIPATINSINTHQNPPSTRSIPTDQYPSKPTINPIKILVAVASPDPHIMSLRALPRRRFWVSCVMVCLLISTSLLHALCFLALVRCCSRKFWAFTMITVGGISMIGEIISRLRVRLD